MSKALLIVPRDGDTSRYPDDVIHALAARLNPENINPNPTAISRSDNVLAAVMNPVPSVRTHRGSIGLGFLLKPDDAWWRPGAVIPDGSYALFRSDADRVELVTSILASRTIWYAHTERVFLASSSQRALVALLSSFEPNPSALSWMLLTGYTGPGQSWDSRIRLVRGDSRVQLDRRTWTICIEERDAVFDPMDAADDELLNRLQTAMTDSFARLCIDGSQWLLPLSGGYDSRAVLLFLVQNHCKPSAVTWGLDVFRGMPETDAGVAKALCEHFGLQHEFLPLNNQSCPIEQAIDRFVALSEGRTDGIEAYWDGFAVWKHIFERGACGVIRGEQTFGQPRVFAELDAREDRSLTLFGDFRNMPSAAACGLQDVELPPFLKRRSGESLSTWRDRLHQEHTMPVCFGALNELKAWYVETADPLDTRRIVETVRTLPDRCRDNKRLFRRLVESLSPPIGFPKRPVVPHPWDVMRTRPVVEQVRAELNTDFTRQLIPDALLSAIQSHIGVSHETPPRREKPLLKRVFHLTPAPVRKILRSTVMKRTLDWNVLAFRAYVSGRITRLLKEDAALLMRAMKR